MTVLVWITEGTWRACVAAARAVVPDDAPVLLLHVTPEDLPGAAHGAYEALLGRGHPERDPGPRVAAAAARSGADLLADAARALGRPCERAERRGRPEREVLTAAAGADLLIVARDGDRSRPGPKSLGHATRFVVDHAPCAVLLVWPGRPRQPGDSRHGPGPGAPAPGPPGPPPPHRRPG